MRLRAVVAVHVDHRRAAGERARDADEPGGIRLGEDFRVLALIRPEPVQHHAERAVALVLLDIEEPGRIARPDDVGRGVDHAVGEVLPRGEIAHAKGQEFRAELVGAPGEFRMIGRMARRREAEEGLAGGERVAVDEDRLLAAVARPAAEDAVLAARAEPRIIGPGAVGLRRLAVVLLDPRPHFGDQGFLQVRGRGERRVGVGVLAFRAAPGCRGRAQPGRAAPPASSPP